MTKKLIKTKIEKILLKVLVIMAWRHPQYEIFPLVRFLEKYSLHQILHHNCQEVSSVDEANEEIDFYRESYGKDKIMNDNVQGEGGTGFFKIWKILSKDLEIYHKIKFGFVGNKNFSVMITMLNPDKVIYNENINSWRWLW